MDLNNLFKQCMYFCIVIMIFTFCLNFMSLLWVNTGAIPSNVPMGKAPKSDTNSTFMDFVQGISGLSGGFGSLWVLASTFTGFGAALLAIATRQTTPIAVYLFGVIFWTSWTRGFASIGPYIPTEISILFTVPIMFIFAGAIIGMLGYSG